MTNVMVDDVIVHYVGKPRFHLRSVSFALSTARDEPQPATLRETDMWKGEGWMVDVVHVNDVHPIDRDDAVQLGRDEAPFTRNGTVKEGYLWPLSSLFAHELLERMDPTGSVETTAPEPAQHDLQLPESPTTVALEEGRALTFEQVLTPARRQAVRSEWQLVDAFVRDRQGERLRRRYPLPGGRNLFADAWFPQARVLVEAKATADRRAVREAIGQLYDYAQKEDGPVTKVVVLPTEPEGDLLAVLSSANITAIWQTPSGWSEAFDDEHLWSPS